MKFPTPIPIINRFDAYVNAKLVVLLLVHALLSFSLTGPSASGEWMMVSKVLKLFHKTRGVFGGFSAVFAQMGGVKPAFTRLLKAFGANLATKTRSLVNFEQSMLAATFLYIRTLTKRLNGVFIYFMYTAKRWKRWRR